MSETIAAIQELVTLKTAPNPMQEITQNIRAEARRLLEARQVDVVIGYEPGWSAEVATPAFVTDASDVDRLVFNAHCGHNLARYLVGGDGFLAYRFGALERPPRVALVALPATMRTVVGLIQEHQVRRGDVVILGIVDGTPLGIEPDLQVGVIAVDQDKQERILVQIQELEKLSVQERWDWWEAQFAKCLRCYACRQVCPFCYCEQCIADQNQPQWIEKSASPESNRVWHTIRAFHLIGRCTGCGECERVCPVEIPLSLLNTKMAEEVAEAFGYVAGMDPDAAPALFSFRADDPGGFVR